MNTQTVCMAEILQKSITIFYAWRLIIGRDQSIPLLEAILCYSGRYRLDSEGNQTKIASGAMPILCYACYVSKTGNGPWHPFILDRKKVLGESRCNEYQGPIFIYFMQNGYPFSVEQRMSMPNIIQNADT